MTKLQVVKNVGTLIFATVTASAAASELVDAIKAFKPTPVETSPEA